jgi:small subunit ribosomal protein S2
MPVATRRELLEAGVHFGHQTRRWNPKMGRFLYGERSGIYIIDLEKTRSGLEDAYDYIRELASRQGVVLFVGTKKQAQEVVADQAARVGMPFVNTRWLGGMLTNFQTISRRLARLRELREMERSGAFDVLPKKEVLKLRHEKEKLERNLGGLQDLERLPDAIFVIDTKKEHIAVTEARKLGLPVVAIVDTNCDPDEVDYVIPGNDDAIRAVSLIARVVADAIEEGRLERHQGIGARITSEPEIEPEPAVAAEQLAAATSRRGPEPAAAAASQASEPEAAQAQASTTEADAGSAPVDEDAPVVEAEPAQAAADEAGSPTRDAEAAVGADRAGVSEVDPAEAAERARDARDAAPSEAAPALGPEGSEDPTGPIPDGGATVGPDEAAAQPGEERSRGS